MCTCFLNLGIAVAQEHAGKVLYNTTVTKIAKQTPLPDDNVNHKFYVHATTNNDGNGDRNERHTFECANVIVATGLSSPNIPDTIAGIELSMGYDELPKTSETFQGESVLVIGAGNSAFETANDMAPHVNYVHVVPGRLKESFDGADRHDFVSWESRYARLYIAHQNGCPLTR